jgi:hypothetical protein
MLLFISKLGSLISDEKKKLIFLYLDIIFPQKYMNEFYKNRSKKSITTISLNFVLLDSVLQGIFAI